MNRAAGLIYTTMMGLGICLTWIDPTCTTTALAYHGYLHSYITLVIEGNIKAHFVDNLKRSTEMYCLNVLHSGGVYKTIKPKMIEQQKPLPKLIWIS